MTPERRAAKVTRSKDGWLEGYPLLWCDEPFTFVRFDPAWPRAICKRPDDSECAIDIRTATPISTDSHRKRAERQRRREAGYKRVECWLSAEDAAWVNKESQRLGLSASGVIQDALDFIKRVEQ